MKKVKEDIPFHHTTIIYVFAIIMGMIGGLAAIALRYLIQFFEWVFLEWLLPYISLELWGINLAYFFIPLLGSVIGGLLLLYDHNIRGSGIPILLESISLKGGKIEIKTGLLKIFSSSLTIGSGGNAGREGPIALIGASFGSFFAKKFKLLPKDRRLLMTCGLAAGIAGSFNAPIGGALFGMEIIFQGVTLIQTVPIFLAAGVGAIIGGFFFGVGPELEWQIAINDLYPIEYGLFIVQAVLFAFLAFSWVKFFAWFQKRNDEWKIPIWVKPIFGGAIMGIILMLFPSLGLYGTGFETIHEILLTQKSIYILLLLGFLKMIGTTATIGTGNSGGIFGPSVFIGFMFGAVYGQIMTFFFPNNIAHVELYSFIGIACFYAAAAQAPLNISVMTAEMLKNAMIIPPTLITSIISYRISKYLFKGSSIYIMRLESYGTKMQTHSIFKMENLRVDDVMTTDLVTVSSDLPLNEFTKVCAEHDHIQQCPVIDFGQLQGMAFLKDIFNVPYEQWDILKVKNIMIKDFPKIPPNLPLQKAMDLMQEKKLRAILVANEYKDNENFIEYDLKGILTTKDIIHVWGESKKTEDTKKED